MTEIEFINKHKNVFFPGEKTSDVQAIELFTGTNLFGSIIVDAYKEDEKYLIYKALDEVANKKDYYSFDSYGIYFFWDYYTKEILYIGLSKNLKKRFGQHNGIDKSKGIGNKWYKIKKYFKTKEKIGYTVFVQSPTVHNNEYLLNKDEEIRIIEGAIIEEHLKKFKKIPQWNEIGGSILGRKERYMKRYSDILEMVNLEKVDFLNAKSTLRELSEDIDKKAYESDLNVFRSNMYKYNETFQESFDKMVLWNEFYIEKGSLEATYNNNRFYEVVKSEYFKKEINL